MLRLVRRKGPNSRRLLTTLLVPDCDSKCQSKLYPGTGQCMFRLLGVISHAQAASGASGFVYDQWV